MNTFNNNETHLSGLHVLAPHWQVSYEWSNMPKSGDGRYDHGTVVWMEKKNNNKICKTSVAVIGGIILEGEAFTMTDSVIILDDILNGHNTKQNNCHIGPNLNESKRGVAASLCHPYVYVLGGETNDHAFLDTIERIQASQLFFDRTDNNDNNDQSPQKPVWTTLQTRLSEPRAGCAAVTVMDRYIVVIGGENDHHALSSIDIIDTLTPPLLHQHHFTAVTVSVGPSMQIPRSWLGATLLDDCIWVIGGVDENDCALATVESLHYGSLENNSNMNDNSSHSIFSASWNLQDHLTLSNGRRGHAIAAIGQCLVVAGGYNDRDLLKSVELLDPQRGLVLALPDLVNRRRGGLMMTMPNQGLLVIGSTFDDRHRKQMESLPCVNLSLVRLKESLQEFEGIQHSTIFGSPLSSLSATAVEPQQSDRTQILRRDNVKRLCNSLVFYYLLEKEGHVPVYHNHVVGRKRKQSCIFK